MKIKINGNWGPFTDGQIIDTPDTSGIPLDRYWRARLKDAVTDNCCEESKPKPEAKAVDKEVPVKPKSNKSKSTEKGEAK